MNDAPPDLPMDPAPPGLWQRASVVWMVPVLALAIAMGIAWQAYTDRGPLIEIVFPEAAGVREGETVLRFRDVDIGLVESVEFTSGLAQVAVRVRLDKDIAEYVDAEASFWIVQPEVTTRGVTGLDTVLGGVYIEGSWDAEPGGLVYAHEGLEKAPLLAGGQQGLTMFLIAGPDASLSAATPILYKGVEVGRIGDPELRPDGAGARAEAVIFAPYDRLVTTSTRFWDTSGFRFSIGAGGAEIDFSSLASLISGGVAFDTIVSGGGPVSDGARFELFAEEARARESLFSRNRGPVANLTVVFDENFAGLATGAAVELDGVEVGDVAEVRGLVDPERFGDDTVRLLATLTLQLSRLGLVATDFEDPLDYIDSRIEGGLRARLATASLLTGGLKVELLDVADAPPGKLDRGGDPYPIVPSAESDISDVSASAEGVFQRINALPIEELIATAIGFLNSATALAQSEELRGVPVEVRGLLGDVRGFVGSDDMQALPARISAVLGGLETTLAELGTLAADLREAELAQQLRNAVESAAAAAAGVETGVRGLPDLIAGLTAVAERAEKLRLDDLIAELTETLTAVRTLLDEDGTRALPERLGTALGELERLIAELRKGDTVENLNSSLASADRATKAIEEAARKLPALSAQMDTLLAQARTTLAGIDQNSELSREAREALRDVQSAAEAVERLARTLERQPNSIILGR